MGIDFIEVADLLPADLDPIESALFASLPIAERDRLLWQRKLTVFFVNPLTATHLAAITPTTIKIVGGERADSRNISVTILSKTATSITLRTSVRGDGSTYRLSIVANADTLDPPASFDPILSGVDFSFRADCPSEFDCVKSCDCPPVETPRIDIDYLARDYATFRRLMLDRIAVLSPNGTSVTRPTSASRSSSSSPMSPTISRTGRTPSRPKRISAPLASASPYGATRDWWTIRCTTAATHAFGCRSCSTTRRRRAGSCCLA
jgi:hypothetical protein